MDEKERILRKRIYNKRYRNKPKNKLKQKKYMKIYGKENKDRLIKYRKEYWQRHGVKERKRISNKISADKPKNKLRIEKYLKGYRQRPEVKERMKKYHQKEEVKAKKRAYSKLYRKIPKNKEKIRLRQRKHRNQLENKIKYKEYKKIPNVNMTLRIRSRIYVALKNYTKTGKIVKSRYYGVDYKAIIEYLKPIPKNLNDYDIHHIRPLSIFNFINEDGSTNIEEVRKAFAPENHKLMLREEHKKINHNKLNIRN